MYFLYRGYPSIMLVGRLGEQVLFSGGVMDSYCSWLLVPVLPVSYGTNIGDQILIPPSIILTIYIIFIILIKDVK